MSFICTGLLSVLRLVTHNPETIMVEYKATTQLLLKQVKLGLIKTGCSFELVTWVQLNIMSVTWVYECYISVTLYQVKNLRSQVGRAAVHVMAALFEQVLITFLSFSSSLSSFSYHKYNVCHCHKYVTVLNIQLKRSMESDLEKIALPLVLKTGETNRFLLTQFSVLLFVTIHWCF